MQGRSLDAAGKLSSQAQFDLVPTTPNPISDPTTFSYSRQSHACHERHALERTLANQPKPSMMSPLGALCKAVSIVHVMSSRK